METSKNNDNYGYGSRFCFSWNIGASLIKYGFLSIIHGCVPYIPGNSQEKRRNCISKLEEEERRITPKDITDENSDVFTEIEVDEDEIEVDEDEIEVDEENKKVLVVKEKEPFNLDEEKKELGDSGQETGSDSGETTNKNIASLPASDSSEEWIEIDEPE